MDVETRRVARGGERVDLSPREFEVLQIFMREPGRTFSRDEICERIWEREHEYDTRTVEIFIMRLRKKLDPDRRGNSSRPYAAWAMCCANPDDTRLALRREMVSTGRASLIP